MALLITKDRKPVIVSAKQGNMLWLLSTGEVTGTPEQIARARSIQKFYLNIEEAPESYKRYRQRKQHQQAVTEIAQARLPYAD
jgi:hypothetical protein